MGYYDNKKRKNFGAIAIIICIAAIILDIVLVNVLKDKSPICRWLWLPLISIALAAVSTGVVVAVDSEGPLLGIPIIVWGIIRGFIVVVAYFKAASGFGILGAIFLCIFMLAFNVMGFVAAGGAMLMPDSDGTSASSNTKAYSRPTPPPKKPVILTTETVKTPYRPQQGDLEKYFSSYACAPQSGSMYFWQSSPSMSSSFGSHSSYTVTGTIGINKQSVEAFHVTSTDMDHYLSSVERDIDRYVDGIIRDYRYDYPDDTTDFKIDIDLKLDIIG